MVWTLIVQGLYLDRTHLELLDVGGHHTATSEKKEEFVRMRGIETEIFERQSNSTSRIVQPTNQDHWNILRHEWRRASYCSIAYSGRRVRSELGMQVSHRLGHR